MPITIKIVFSDNTLIQEGVHLQLLNSGAVVAKGTTANNGTVTFDVDASELTRPAINLPPG